MPAVQGYTPIDLKQFGGLCTLLDATNLPIYMSPDTRNVEFLPGLVRSRPGTTSQFSTLTGIPNVNFLKSYITQLLEARLLVLDSFGNLYKEDPTGTLTQFATIETPGDYCNSVSLFSREYMAFGDNLFGSAIPRQYDDTNFDRVSQVGPGAPPNITANSASVDIVDITQPAAVTNVGTNNPIRGLLWSNAPGLTGVGNVITIYYTPASNPVDPNLTVGANVVISNFLKGNVAFPNGVWKITSLQDLVIGGVLYHTFSYNGPANDHVVNNVPTGASYQATLATVTTSTPNTSIMAGGEATISGASVPAWDLAWPIDAVPLSSGMTVTSTSLTSNVATYGFTLNTNPATGFPYPAPSSGQIVTVTGTANGGGVFNVNQQTITGVIGSTFTIALTSPNVASAGDAGNASVSGTVFSIDPVDIPSLASAPILGNSTGGTLTGNGSMVAGPRQVAVSFVTRNGYITRPSPPLSFNLSSSNSITVSQIPTGPSDVVQRILMFTPMLATTATLGSFYTIEPDMIINDNVTTSITLNFTDTTLLEGTSQDYLFDLDELPEAAGVTEYNDRLFWWGVRDNILNFDNLSFDGGFDPLNSFPLGWTLDPVNGAGGFGESTIAIFGAAWAIQGDGVSFARGMISQNCYADEFGARRFPDNTPISIRLRVRKDTGMLNGNINVEVFIPSTSTVLGTFVVSGSAVSNTTFTEFSGSLIGPQSNLPTDAVVRLYAANLATAGQNFYIEDIEFFNTNSPYLPTTVWASQAELPENYDGVNGLISVAPENGQAVRDVFRIRNYLYVAKERSLYVTADDGQNEPSSWTVNEVSATVGTPSPRGVGLGDEWAVVASKSGLYMFNGASITDEDKLSTEIQPTWDAINWNAGQTIIVKVDTTRKRIYCAVPMGTATIPNQMLVLDYVEGFTNPLTNNGSGRKWNIWDIPCNSMDFIVREKSFGSVGPSVPQTIALDGGSPAWSNPSNIASPTSYATVNTTTTVISGKILCTNLGFSLPVEASIVGFQVGFDAFASSGGSVNLAFRLLSGGSEIGLQHKQLLSATAGTHYTLGGTNDNWSVNLTGSDVNDPSFGFSIGAIQTVGGSFATSARKVTITVSYTIPAADVLPLFIGNNTNTGKIYKLDSSAHNDDGLAIDSHWQSGYFQENTRLNFGYLIVNVIGSGTCNLTLRQGNQGYLRALRGWNLSTSTFFNMERQIQSDSSRMAILFGTNAPNDWFSLQGASLFVQPSIWSPLRGANNVA